MEFKENHSLKSFNTFGINVDARYLTDLTSEDQLLEILDFQEKNSLDHLILGGGSNVLFTKNYNGLVIKNSLMGIDLIKEDDHHIWIEVGGGENWHSFVMHCVKNGWSGVENMSLIPGCVGAAPMQNIGAYGVEIKDVFDSLKAFHLQEKKWVKFTNYECEFGYRESVFKNKFKGQFLIGSCTFKLTKKPVFNTKYGAIEKELESMGVTDLSIDVISQAVINIRSTKLPDPSKIGNAGSFFKNPVLSKEAFEKVLNNHPDVVHYPAGEKMKLAAGWLIDQAGWKGHTRDTHGVHKNQALVLVNYGGAEGQQILQLSHDIQQNIKEKFGVELEREVNLV